MSPLAAGLALEIGGALRDAGLPAGVPLILHAGMAPLTGLMTALGEPAEEARVIACTCLANGLEAAVGPQGTVCVPGYFYDYARKGIPYDARSAEPDGTLGAFPRYFFRHRMKHRSLNPLLNLMSAGAQSEWVATLPSLYGYGPLSPWARMVEAGGWVLFFGTSPATNTFTHHVEQLAGVPHLYNKIYRIPVTDLEGRVYPISLCAVRYLDSRFPIDYVLGDYGKELEADGVMLRGVWRGIDFHMAPLRDIQTHLLERLRDNPFALLSAEPRFIRGVIPDDGPSPA